MGGGKGGSDFDPKGKSEGEVMRFCQALMTELYRHLGPDTDVPAGDIGVGGREVGFMAGMMKKLSNNSACVFTGKGLSFGGNLIRPEATGYGLVYFTEAMLKRHGLGFEGMRVAVSGSGNVAQYAIEKAMQFGARVITASDSSGTVVDEAGFTTEKLARLCEIKASRDGRVADYAREFGLTYLEGKQPWSVPVDIALPCATQNELDADAAQQLIANGVKAVAEGANMPTTIEATDLFLEAGVLFAPGKPQMPVAWPPQGWRWRKTRREWAGRQRKWMPDCTTSCWIFTMRASSTVAKKRKPITCAVQILPGS